MLRECVFAEEAAVFARIDLPAEAAVVAELVLRKVPLVCKGEMRLRHFWIVLQKPEQAEHEVAVPLADSFAGRIVAFDSSPSI